MQACESEKNVADPRCKGKIGMAVKQKWWLMEESMTELLQERERAQQQRQVQAGGRSDSTVGTTAQAGTTLVKWMEVDTLRGTAPLRGRLGTVRTNHH